MRGLALALGFLTRLPVPPDPAFTPARMAAALGWAPLVGALVGAVGAGVLLLATMVVPPLTAVLLALAATILITGALHEDGLADLCDGLGGGGATSARALEIMRDSRIGTYGALGMGLFAALLVSVLTALPAAEAAAVLICGHTLARWLMVEVAARYPYARGPDGTGGFATDGLPATALWIARTTAAVTLAGGIWRLGPAAAAGAGLALALAIALGTFTNRQLGGWTGDVLGAVVCLALAGFGIGLLAWR